VGSRDFAGASRLGITVAVLAGWCTSCGTPAVDDPRVVLQRLADEGDDAPRLAAAVLALTNPEIAFVGEIPITLRRADGSLPSYLVHPQGLAWLPETRRWAISAVEITRERDKRDRPEGDPNGEGRPYVFFADVLGRPVPSSTIEPPVTAGSYHPGGIDSADGSIYLSLSPYMRDSRAELLRLPPASGVPVPTGTVDDHIGMVTISAGREPALLHAASWDARRWYTLGLDGRILWSTDSPLAIGFQDGQGVRGTDYVLWSGVVNPDATAFGFSLIRINGEKLEPARTIQWRSDRYPTPQEHPPLFNAAFFWADRAHRIWVLAMPDDQHGRWRPRPPHPADAAAVADVEDPQAGRGAALRLYRVFSGVRPAVIDGALAEHGPDGRRCREGLCTSHLTSH
jgi:hypothetical protein